VHRAPAQRADLGEAQHSGRPAPPRQERRKSVPPADLATRRRERPPRHLPTHLRHEARRRTLRQSRQLDERPNVGMEIPVRKPFHARRTAARQVTPCASASTYLAYRRRVTIGAVLGVTCPGFPGVTHATSPGGLKPPVPSLNTGVKVPPSVAAPRGHGAAHSGPRRVLRCLRGQGVEGRLDRGHGPRSHGAPRPKLPTLWQLGIRRARTPGGRGHAGHRPAQRTEGGRVVAALRRPGAAHGGQGADLLRPRDPGCQRRRTGGPWADVCNGRGRQIPRAVPLRAAGTQLDRAAQGQRSDGPQAGPANVAFVMKCDVPATAPAGTLS